MCHLACSVWGLEVRCVMFECSGPLPRATNATEPFFKDLIYFNASSNNLTGPIPEDFGHAELFSASSLYYKLGVVAYLIRAAFDVSNNQLSGDLPTFLTPSRVPQPLLSTSGITLLVSRLCQLYESSMQSRYICNPGCSSLLFESRERQDTYLVCIWM